MQSQATLLLAAATEEIRSELREIFQNEYQLMEAQSPDQLQVILSDRPGEISVLLLDASSQPHFAGDQMVSAIQAAASQEIPVMVLLNEQDTNSEIIAYQYGASIVTFRPFLPLALFQRTKVLADLHRYRGALKSMEGIQERAERDVLTGLYNRGAVRQYVNRLLSDNPSQKTGISALLMIDLDNFKNINDTYGHLFGDEVLTRSASQIRKLFRSNDIIGRIGGDEFTVFIDSIPDIELIKTRCSQLIEALHTSFFEDESKISISASVGVALVPEHGNTLNELYRKADLALYQAKKLGKNQYCIYNEKESEACPIRELVSAVNTHIDSDIQPGIAEDSLLHFVFQRLYETGDIYGTINEILGEIGRQMNVSRVYIFENNKENTGASNTFEWCNQNIEPQMQNMQHLSYLSGAYRNWPDYYDENGVFYCADVSQLPDDLKQSLENQNIKSLLHSSIVDDGVFRGFIGFDECVNNRIWTATQIQTLVLLAKVLAVFLLKERLEDESSVTRQNLQSILNSQNAWIYVIDPETFRLRYVNEQTRNLSPVVREGAYCYEVLMNRSSRCPDCPARNILEDLNRESFIDNTHMGLYVRAEASRICWDGEDSCLVTCRKVFQ